MTSTPTSARPVTVETFMLPSADPGVQLYVCNKRSEPSPQQAVLFVHGATYPCEAMFDTDLPGGSWMENLARAGYDVYSVDVRGYGHSTRPTVMDAPSEDNPPFASTADAIGDVEVAVDFILERTGLAGVNLIGWSWGTTIMGGYTERHNDKVNKLVLYGAVWHIKGAPPISGTGAYRAVTREDTRARVLRGIPADRAEDISPTAWFDAWWQISLATDPVGSRQTPPVLRAPNGVLQDLDDYWRAGESTWDPQQVRVPTLVIGGEWDFDTPPSLGRKVFAELVNTPSKRLVVIGEGTHTLALEKNREQLMREVQHFLDE